jgi:hypothetical protein
VKTVVATTNKLGARCVAISNGQDQENSVPLSEISRKEGKFTTLKSRSGDSYVTKLESMSKPLVFLLLAMGLWSSLKIVLGTVGFEADTSLPIVLWQGVRAHGLPWIKDFIFTQDNWLFSWVPLQFLAFSIFGAKPAVVILSGWSVFVSSAFASGALAWKVGAKRSCALVTVVLLNFGLYAHASGFVSYPASHCITNLMGLLSVFVLASWNMKSGSLYPIILFSLLTAGAMSDPWMLATYNVPILLVAVLFWVKPLKQLPRQQSVRVIIVASLSIICVKARLLGILSFLPRAHFHKGHWPTIASNGVYLVRDFGGFLNLVPFSRSNHLLPAVISIAILAIFVLKSASELFRRKPALNETTVCFIYVASLSLAGIFSAFILTDTVERGWSARYLINAAYLLVILISVISELNWKHSRVRSKWLLAFIAVLFLGSSTISTFKYISSRAFSFQDNGIQDTIAFLKQNGLSYGYGPYWGVNANAVTAASSSQVVIRPVMFDKNNGMIVRGTRVESSKRWYTAEDIPAGVNDYFVIVNSDGEECPDVKVCITGLSRQLGTPDRRIKRGVSTILVWNHRPLTRTVWP